MQVGTIEGEVNTSNFKFRATEEVKKFDFISVKSNEQWILAQVEEVTKNSDGETHAQASIIGYRDKGLTKAPRRVIEPDSIVYQADQELISETLGLDDEGLTIGNLETNPEIDIHVDPEDFYKHFAVLAQTGAGKCVTPETPILKSDGSTKQIREIFEDAGEVVKDGENEELRLLEDCSVKAIDDEYKTLDADALYAYRKKADKVLKIKTSSGREIEVTPEHPLMVAEEDYGFVNSEEIEEGQHLAVPRKVNSNPNESMSLSKELIQEVDEESERRMEANKKYKKYHKLSRQGHSVSEIAEELRVPQSTIENWEYQGYQPDAEEGLALSMNAKGIEVPETFSQEFAEFLSLIIAEGTEQQAEGSYRVIFTNNEARLLERFRELSDQLFGLETGTMSENADYIDSTSLKHLLDDMGYETLQKSRGKEMPSCVMKSSKESKKVFLRTFFDCEGSIEDHEVTLSSASEEIINSLSYMLLDFGIVSRISSREKVATNSDHEGNTYYHLSISGTNQLEKFSEGIGFGIERKQEKLEKYLSEKEGNTNIDVVPVEGDYLKQERVKAGISQRKLAEEIDSHSTLVSLYERNERRPSREKFSGIAERLDSELFSQLSNSDILWDKVESVEEKEYNDYVYDLTVRNHHNFIAGRGGIVSHNSYLTGVIIEELLEKDFPVLIMDPHGEYSSLKYPNPENEEEQKAYDVKEFSPNTDINQEALPLRFSSMNLGKKELMTLIPDSLTNSQMGVLYNALKRLKEKDEDYSLLDIEDSVSQEDSTAKWNLLNYLEQLEESGLFSENPIDLEDIVEPGRATIINLKAVEPDTTEMTAYMLAKKLFEMRKENRIPPFLMIMEEAHNFVPEKGFGQTLSNDIMRKIASEGRKFGLGIGVISQRPARIDKNVLSQCNTQFILRVTNPNDIKAISKSFEGINSEVESMIKSLPPGVCFALGNEYPVMTEVRTRKSKHGGETQTGDSYQEKEKIEYFDPKIELADVESQYGEKFSRSYYPFYLVEDLNEKKLVDGVKDQVKADRKTVSGLTEKVFKRLKNGKEKQEIVDELDVGISKVASKVEELQKKGLLEGTEVVESLFNLGWEEDSVNKDELIDKEVSREGIENEFPDSDISLVYYPYYSSGEVVYDPILEKEVD